MTASNRTRVVRIPEELFLQRPELWTREGLEAFLRENGIDTTKPYMREDTFVQPEESLRPAA
jgi:virulence-associated protein VagC